MTDASSEFRMPDVGEGLTEAEILKWYVKPGDTVTVNQVDRARSRRPRRRSSCPARTTGWSPSCCRRGRDRRRRHADHHGRRRPGRSARAPPAAQAAAEDLVPNPPAEQAVEPGLIGSPTPGGRTRSWSATGRAGRDQAPAAQGRRRSGAGCRAGRDGRRRRPTPAPAAPPAPRRAAVPSRSPPRRQRRPSRRAPRRRGPGTGRTAAVLAKPPVRKLAKDLGVDLGTVTGDRPGRRRSPARTSSRAARGPAEPLRRRAPATAAGPGATRETADPDQGRAQGTPPQAMVASAFTAPHVTEFVHVDVTADDEAASSGAERRRSSRGVRVSPLLLVAKALLVADQRGTRRSTRPGTRRPRRSCSSTTSTWASPRPPRAA